MNKKIIPHLLTTLVILVLGANLYKNAESVLPESIVMQIKPDTTYYAKKQQQEMYKDLVFAHNVYQGGERERAIELAEKVWERGMIYFQGRSPDYNDEKDRLIADRMLATSSWLAGWTSNSPALSEYYAQEAHSYAHELHGPTYFWTISHLFDVGSRRLDQSDFPAALDAYTDIIKTYRQHTPDSFTDTDRIAGSYAIAAQLHIQRRDYRTAHDLATEGLPIAEGKTKQDLMKILRLTKNYK
jgi:hypothetical protein